MVTIHHQCTSLSPGQGMQLSLYWVPPCSLCDSPQVTWPSGQVTTQSIPSGVSKSNRTSVQMPSPDGIHSPNSGLYATVTVAGRRTWAHLLYQVPAQEPYNQQSRSAQSQSLLLFPQVPSYLASLFSLACFQDLPPEFNLLPMAPSPPPSLLPDSLLQGMIPGLTLPQTSSVSDSFPPLRE